MRTVYCKKCSSPERVKAGFVHGHQRYKCKNCQSYYLPAPHKTCDHLKQQAAVDLYLEGMSLRGIGRYLDVSHVTVIRWLRKLSIRLKPAIPLRVTHIEIDELYLYIGNKKKKRWLWLAVCRESRRILDFQLGGRGKATLQKLLYKIQPVECKKYYTDRHGPFKSVFPAHKHHSVPGNTNTIEGINSAVRHYLARFRRRSKCYSKSLVMVEASIRLLMYKFDRRYQCAEGY